MKEQIIRIEVGRVGIPIVVPVVQTDSGRKLRCIITDMMLKDTYAARIYAVKPTKKEIFNDCVINGNAVVVKLTDQILAEVGYVSCQIKITNDAGERVSSFEFILDVKKDLMSESAIESSNEFKALESVLSNVEGTIRKETQDYLEENNVTVAKAFYVTISKENGEYVSDKTVAEIEEAYQNGHIVSCIFPYDENCIIPLTSRITQSIWTFQGVLYSDVVSVMLIGEMVTYTKYSLDSGNIDPRRIKDMYYAEDMIEVFPETTLTMTGGDGMYMFENIPFTLEVGKTYNVGFNGAYYQLECIEMDGAIAVGDMAGGTFMIAIESGMCALIVTDTSLTEVTLSISEGGKIHKLDSKFIDFVDYTPIGDTFMWNKDTTGLDQDEMLYRVTGVYPSIGELSKGGIVIIETETGDVIEVPFTIANVQASVMDGIFSANIKITIGDIEDFPVVHIRNVDSYGSGGGRSGTYFWYHENSSIKTIGLKINGFEWGKPVVQNFSLPEEVMKNGDERIILSDANGDKYALTIVNGELTVTKVTT